MKVNFLEKRFGTLKFISASNVDESIVPFIHLIKKERPKMNLLFLPTAKLAKATYFRKDAKRQVGLNPNC